MLKAGFGLLINARMDLFSDSKMAGQQILQPDQDCRSGRLVHWQTIKTARFGLAKAAKSAPSRTTTDFTVWSASVNGRKPHELPAPVPAEFGFAPVFNFSNMTKAVNSNGLEILNPHPGTRSRPFCSKTIKVDCGLAHRTTDYFIMTIPTLKKSQLLIGRF